MTLRELEQAATPAPWYSAGYDDGSGWFGAAKQPISRNPLIDQHDAGGIWMALDADAAFIAALRNAAPLLLDVVDAARFFAEEYPEVPDYDLPSENTAIRQALAALDAAT